MSQEESWGSGGGVFNNAGTVTIRSSQVTENEAERAGGGIEDRNGTGTSITLIDVTLNDNVTFGTDPTAQGNGGGLHVTGSGSVSISGGTVNRNAADLEGGGLWNGTGTLTISNGTMIDSNVAHGAAANDGGGGIFNNGGTLMIGWNSVRHHHQQQRGRRCGRQWWRDLQHHWHSHDRLDQHLVQRSKSCGWRHRSCRRIRDSDERQFDQQ